MQERYEPRLVVRGRGVDRCEAFCTTFKFFTLIFGCLKIVDF
jgi:hypothetical protein